MNFEFLNFFTYSNGLIKEPPKSVGLPKIRNTWKDLVKCGVDCVGDNDRMKNTTTTEMGRPP